LSDRSSFVLRIRDSQERQLRVRRELYVGIRRGWSPGSKVVFVKKAPAGDSIIGIGVMEKVVELDAMDGGEKKACLENNWYGKIVFSQVARFHPPVPVRDTDLASVPPALLHGHGAGDVSKMEGMSAKLVA
jgi:hypothetical protein